jgi:TPR repeat protein
MFSRRLANDMTRDEALGWLERAALQGHQRAAFELAQLRAQPIPEDSGAAALDSNEGREAGARS